MNAATAQTRIDAIDAILAAGVSSVTMNGRSVTYDFSALTKERDRLQAWLNRGAAGKNLRVGRYNPDYTG